MITHLFNSFPTVLLILFAFVAGDIFGMLSLIPFIRKLAPGAKALEMKIASYKMTMAGFINERDQAVSELSVIKSRNEEALRRNDPVETMKRIQIVLDKQTWPNNSDIAGMVEILYGEYKRMQVETAAVNRKIRLIEEPWLAGR